nr:MAG TPA: SH3 domain protein [Caudoviricetes sp.]
MIDKCLDVNKYRDWLVKQAEDGAQYWYGAVYQRASAQLLLQKSRQYPEHYKSNRMSKYNSDVRRGVFVGDCVNGSVKGAIWTDLGTHAIKYKSHGCPDTNADGFYKLCANACKHGSIDSVPDAPGILLHKSGHVGVTIGDGKAVEFRGFNYGCVITKIRDRGWKEWAYMPWVDYDAATDVKPAEPAEAEPAGKVWKTTGNVWARSYPMVAADNKMQVIRNGAVVDVIKPCDGWMLIRTADGKLAYVSKKYLREE